jgi:hypothetical protein
MIGETKIKENLHTNYCCSSKTSDIYKPKNSYQRLLATIQKSQADLQLTVRQQGRTGRRSCPEDHNTYVWVLSGREQMQMTACVRAGENRGGREIDVGQASSGCRSAIAEQILEGWFRRPKLAVRD